MIKFICSGIFIWCSLLGSTRLFAQATNKIDSIGDVGIGTIAPISKLDISDAISGHKIYKEVNAGQPDYSYYYLKIFKVPSGTGSPTATFNGKISAIRSNDIEVSQSADIYLSRDYYGAIYFSQLVTAGGRYGPFALVKITDAGEDWVALSYDASPGPGIIGWMIDGTLYQESVTLTSFTSVTSLTPIHSSLSYAIRNIRIADGNFSVDGHLGVGTTSPGAKMEVFKSDGDYIGYFTGGSNTMSRLAVRNETSQGALEFDVAGGDNPYGYIQTGKSTNIPLKFSATYYQFDNGNVGIGTTSPSEKLSVNGNISSKKSIVTQTGWSDYVFNDDYKLRPLNEVSKFIRDNKHLPEVPSAKEVGEKGLDLGANQAVLLKKIEELTLYMIDLKKENDQQQMEIEKLKKQKTRK